MRGELTTGRHRVPGLKPRISAAEINQWNRSTQKSSSLIEQPGQPHFLEDDRQSLWVWIQNDSGTDRERFEALGLGDPLFELTDDGTVELIFSGIAPDVDEDPAILLEPIAAGDAGRAVIDGLAIAKVAAGTDKQAELSASAVLTPNANGSIRLLATPNAGSEKLLPVLLGGGKATTGITDLRLQGTALQFEKDGQWTTWHTATTCP